MSKCICKRTGRRAKVASSSYAAEDHVMWMDTGDGTLTYIVHPGLYEKACKDLLREETKLEKLMRGLDE